MHVELDLRVVVASINGLRLELVFLFLLLCPPCVVDSVSLHFSSLSSRQTFESFVFVSI